MSEIRRDLQDRAEYLGRTSGDVESVEGAFRPEPFTMPICIDAIPPFIKLPDTCGDSTILIAVRRSNLELTALCLQIERVQNMSMPNRYSFDVRFERARRVYFDFLSLPDSLHIIRFPPGIQCGLISKPSPRFRDLRRVKDEFHGGELCAGVVPSDDLPTLGVAELSRNWRAAVDETKRYSKQDIFVWYLLSNITMSSESLQGGPASNANKLEEQEAPRITGGGTHYNDLHGLTTE
ncbi:hypothetical protein C8R43DRAFT_942146 [Mycena crocata]|nr:hypothetical protein C8R43DRAFT_942146 [Mycena crocata]